MINQIVTEILDYFGLWGSPYFQVWSLLFEVFVLILLLVALLIPIILVYYIVKMVGGFKYGN